MKTFKFYDNWIRRKLFAQIFPCKCTDIKRIVCCWHWPLSPLNFQFVFNDVSCWAHRMPSFKCVFRLTWCCRMLTETDLWSMKWNKSMYRPTPQTYALSNNSSSYFLASAFHSLCNAISFSNQLLSTSSNIKDVKPKHRWNRIKWA